MSTQRPKTASELMSEMQNDPTIRKRMEERNHSLLQRQEQLATLISPTIKALNSIGCDGDTIEGIVKNNAPLKREAVTVLMKSLSDIDEPRLIESIVRALGAAETQFDGSRLAQIFLKTKDEAVKLAVINTIALIKPYGIEDWLLSLRNTYWNEKLKAMGFDYAPGSRHTQ